MVVEDTAKKKKKKKERKKERKKNEKKGKSQTGLDSSHFVTIPTRLEGASSCGRT